MNKDVRIGTNYPDHPKVLKLVKQLGAEGVMSHVFLLCFVARTRPSGVLEGMDAEDIAEVAKWRGDPNEFVNTLVELRLLERNGINYEIHNWLRHNLFAASAPKRSEIARANIKKRWDKKTKVIQRDDTDGNTPTKESVYTPSPSPSPRREGEGHSPPLEAGGGVPQPTVDSLLQLAMRTYRGDYVDATLERLWVKQYRRLPDNEKDELHELAGTIGVRLPDPTLYK
jgi:hypothetical protein